MIVWIIPKKFLSGCIVRLMESSIFLKADFRILNFKGMINFLGFKQSKFEDKVSNILNS